MSPIFSSPQRYVPNKPSSIRFTNSYMLKDGTEDIVEEYLIQNYVGVLSRVARVWKADLKKVRSHAFSESIFELINCV